MNLVMRRLFFRRGAAAAAGVICLVAAGSLPAQVLNRGNIVDIRSFRPVRLTTSSYITLSDGTVLKNGVEVTFRIAGRGDFPDIRSYVTFFDAEMNPLGRPAKTIFDFDRRQREGEDAGYLDYDNRGWPDTYRSGRSYSVSFFTNESYRYALVEVGNREEKVYAVYPRGTPLEELLARK